MAKVSEDLLKWEAGLPDWQSDALRRVVDHKELSDKDYEELRSMVLANIGADLAPTAPAPVRIDAKKLKGVNKNPTVRIKSIDEIKNVNRLHEEASLDFSPNGLTIVYGRNGSGKTGFVRILRGACRSRVVDPKQLSVLGDIYGDKTTGPASARLIVETSQGPMEVHWKEGAREELLSGACVFDSDGASLYVNSGSYIEFLPFDLDLPFRLNQVVLKLHQEFRDKRDDVTQQSRRLRVDAAPAANTAAAAFLGNLSGLTTDEEIDQNCAFGPSEEIELKTVNERLSATDSRYADQHEIRVWIEGLASALDSLSASLSKPELDALVQKKREQSLSRKAADTAADQGFSTEAIPHVGSELWRRLWEAARDYSLAEAYPDKAFPATGKDALCVLCHQPLEEHASERLMRFEGFVRGSLEATAEAAEKAYEEAASKFRSLKLSPWSESPEKQLQLKARDEGLHGEIQSWTKNFEKIHGQVCKLLEAEGDDVSLRDIAVQSAPDLTELLCVERDAEEALKESLKSESQQDLKKRAVELEGKQALAEAKDTVRSIRDCKKEFAAWQAAFEETTTTNLTRAGSRLLDNHLTGELTSTFIGELDFLDLRYLPVKLTRQTSRRGADHKTDLSESRVPTSKILSEGEQRALALAAYLAEVSVQSSDGPLIVDDPVSSLDDYRSEKVAKRLVDEARKRQVIVFTHKLDFLNTLLEQCSEEGVAVDCKAIFSDAEQRAGKADPVGLPWKGQKLEKRLNVLRQDATALRKVRNESLADYGKEAKNIYGRIRDGYERFVEEHLFSGVITRWKNEVATLKLRALVADDDIIRRHYDGMTKSSRFSHDNPKAASVEPPEVDEILKDIDDLFKLIADIEAKQKDAAKNRAYFK